MELGLNFKYIFNKYYVGNKIGICIINSTNPLNIIIKTNPIFNNIYSKGRVIICSTDISVYYYTYLNDELINISFLKNYGINLEVV